MILTTPRTRPQGRSGRALALGGLVLGAWAGAVVVNRSLRRVEGDSMLPTLWPGELVLTVPRRVLEPQRGDVVVVELPGRPTSIKRLAGLPGEQLHLQDGHLFARGGWWKDRSAVLVDEDVRFETGPGEVVVLGDHRAASTDSRQLGPIPDASVTRTVLATINSWRWLRSLAPVRLDGPRPRPTVRLIVLDPDDQVLLFEVKDRNDPTRTFWETPGGGINAGEHPDNTAGRELFEEVGLQDQRIVPLDATRERISNTSGAPTRKVEQFYAVRAPSQEVCTDRWTDNERDDIVGWKWFAVGQLSNLDVATTGIQDLIAAAASALVAGGFRAPNDVRN